jgi:hypothetical protein
MHGREGRLPISMAQIPVPVPRSKILWVSEGMGARCSLLRARFTKQ